MSTPSFTAAGGPQANRTALRATIRSDRAPLLSTPGGVVGGVGDAGIDTSLLNVPPAAETDLYKEENARLKSEVTALRDQLARQIKVLKTYQLRFPAEELQVTKVELDGLDEPPPWMTDPEMMPPVFIHYDQLIVESQRKHDELQQQLATSMASIELLKAENEQLREKQIQDVEALLAPSGGKSGEGGISSEVAAEQVRELTERLDIIVKERDILVQQAGELTTHLSSLENERGESDKKIFEQSEHLRDAQEALQYFEKHVAELRQEKQTVEQRFMQQSQELSAARADSEEAAESARVLQVKYDELSAYADQAQREKHAMAKQLEDETEALQDKIQNGAARIRELQTKLATKTHESETAQQKARTYSRDLEQMRQDNEGMITLMGGLEKQLAEFAGREERTDQLATECRESAEKALLERDTAVATEAYLRQELARLREVRKQETEDRQKQHESALALVKEDAERLVKAKDLVCQKLNEEKEQANVDKERAEREKDAIEVRAKQLSATLESERKIVSGECRQLRDRIQAAEDKATDQILEFEQSKSSNRNELQSLQRAAREFARQQKELQDQCNQFQEKSTELEEKLHEAVEARERAIADRQHAQSELDASTANLAKLLHLEKTLPVKDSTIKDLEYRIEAMTLKHTDEKQGLVAKLAKTSHETAALKTDKRKQEALLSQQLAREREAVESTSTSLHTLTIRCSELSVEVADLQAAAQEAQQRADHCESALDDAEARIAQLSMQLSESYSKDQTHIKEISRLKGELARVRIGR